MILSRIKAVFFAIEFVISIVVVVILMIIFKQKQRKVRQIWARTQRFFGLYNIEVVGEFNQEANMIMMNHQSMLDIVALEEVHPRDLCWLAKKEIAKIPIIGKIIDVPKMIAVDRESKHSLVKIIKDSEDRVLSGRVLAIFPEGTRSQSGKMLPFKGGAKLIADKLKLKIQPVVIIGSDIMDVKKFSFKGGTIKILCLDPVDTSDKNWLEATREIMQKAYDKEAKI